MVALANGALNTSPEERRALELASEYAIGITPESPFARVMQIQPGVKSTPPSVNETVSADDGGEEVAHPTTTRRCSTFQLRWVSPLNS